MIHDCIAAHTFSATLPREPASMSSSKPVILPPSADGSYAIDASLLGAFEEISTSATKRL